MTGRWEFADHTADVGLVAYGSSLAEALAAAGSGLFDLMVDVKSIGETTSRQIEVAGADSVDLLVSWLNELLYLFEVKRLLLRRFEVEVTPDGCRLRATGHGERLDPARHEVKIGVKAATYHLASVEQTPSGKGEWRAQVILDV